jgi:hypothetical protein
MGRVLRADAQRIAGIGDREETTVLYVTLPRRLGWGVRMLAEGREKGLGELLEPVLSELVRGQRIPWSWYDELHGKPGIAAEETQPAPSQEAPENGAVESAEPAVILTPTPPIRETGEGEGDRDSRRKKPAAQLAAEHAARKRAG